MRIPTGIATYTVWWKDGHKETFENMIVPYIYDDNFLKIRSSDGKRHISIRIELLARWDYTMIYENEKG